MAVDAPPLLRFIVPLRTLGASGNMRIHWSERGRRNAGLRSVVHMHALQARHESRQPVCFEQRRRVHFGVVWPASKKGKLPDLDNLVTMLKAALDGLTSAHVIHDDSERWLAYDMPTQIRNESVSGRDVQLWVSVWPA